MKLFLLKIVNSKHWNFILTAIICSFLLIWPSLYNGFALLYSDSGSYLDSGIHLKPPLDRPLFYGYFLRLTTMQAFTWGAVIAQGFFSFWVIHRVLKQFDFSRHYLSLI